MFAEDLSPFMNVSEFGTACTLNGVAAVALFDAGYALGNVGPFGASGSGPTLTLATASLPANPVGVAVVCNGVSYTVVEHQPDGTGMSLLQLRNA